MRNFIIFTLTKYYFGDQIKANEMGSRHVPHSGINRPMYRVLVGKFQGRGPLGRLRHSWNDGIKMYLKKWDERGGLNESRSGYGEVLGCCERSIDPLGSIKRQQFLE
jgi:hypothetical protein